MCCINYSRKHPFDRRGYQADNESAMPTVTPKPKKRIRQTPRGKVEKAGPSNEKLKRLAKSSPPPQEWFDATDNPFEKSKK
jgi:hypothetical protein